MIRENFLKKEKIMKNMILIFTLLFLTGCVHYVKKSEPILNEYAQLVVFTDEVGKCEILGEISSYATANGHFADFNNFDRYVRGDLRNQASVFAKNKNIIKLRIIDRQTRCFHDWQVDCAKNVLNGTSNEHIRELKYTAEILKCN